MSNTTDTAAEPTILSSIPSIHAWEATRAAFLRLHREISDKLTAGTMPPREAHTELAVLRGLYAAFQVLSNIGHPDREYMRARLHELAERMTPAAPIPPEPQSWRVEMRHASGWCVMHDVSVREKGSSSVAYADAYERLIRCRDAAPGVCFRVIPVLDV